MTGEIVIFGREGALPKNIKANDLLLLSDKTTLMKIIPLLIKMGYVDNGVVGSFDCIHLKNKCINRRNSINIPNNSIRLSVIIGAQTQNTINIASKIKNISIAVGIGDFDSVLDIINCLYKGILNTDCTFDKNDTYQRFKIEDN